MRSSSVSVADSPVDPVTTSPSEPLSTRNAASSRNLVRLTAPSESNGVTLAVRTSPSTTRSYSESKPSPSPHRESPPPPRRRHCAEPEWRARVTIMAGSAAPARRRRRCRRGSEGLLVALLCRDERRERSETCLTDRLLLRDCLIAAAVGLIDREAPLFAKEKLQSRTQSGAPIGISPTRNDAV